MNRAQLSAAAWDTSEKAHAALAKALAFPDYYGHNLDALHDCLASLTDTQLVITNCGEASRKMDKWPGFLAVFCDAAAENPGLDIRLMP